MASRSNYKDVVVAVAIVIEDDRGDSAGRVQSQRDEGRRGQRPVGEGAGGPRLTHYAHTLYSDGRAGRAAGRVRVGLAEAALQMGIQSAHAEDGDAAGQAERPGRAGEGGDGLARHEPGQRPEGCRPARGGGEEQRGGGGLPHAEQQQKRHQRNLEQERHVYEHADRCRDCHAPQIVAQVGGHRVRADPLDNEPAGEACRGHDGREPNCVAQAVACPISEALPQRGAPRDGEVRGVIERLLRPRLGTLDVSHDERDERADEQSAHQADDNAAAAQHRGEDQRNHYERGHVEGGRCPGPSLWYRRRPLRAARGTQQPARCTPSRASSPARRPDLAGCLSRFRR